MRAGHCLGIPINGEMRQVIGGPRLIPVVLEGGTNQVHFIAHLALMKIGGIDIS